MVGGTEGFRLDAFFTLLAINWLNFDIEQKSSHKNILRESLYKCHPDIHMKNAIALKILARIYQGDVRIPKYQNISSVNYG